MDHRRHHHHHHRREEDEYPPPPPPPFYPGNEPPPPSFYDPPPPSFYDPPPPSFYDPSPPQVYHTSHSGPGPDTYPPPPPPTFTTYPPPPFAPPPIQDHHHHHPHMPHFHHSHHNHDEIANKPSVRIYSKAEPNYSLTIRDGKVVLARANPSDPFQQWVKDERFSTRVKDGEGFPSFALINKATGQAIKHSIGATHPVQLTPYNPNALDESILWTESKDLGDTYRAIRMVNNIRLNIDAFNGDKNHGGVHDGTKIVLWEWKKGDNQRWKIVPYCKSRQHISYHSNFYLSSVDIISNTVVYSFSRTCGWWTLHSTGLCCVKIMCISVA